MDVRGGIEVLGGGVRPVVYGLARIERRPTVEKDGGGTVE